MIQQTSFIAYHEVKPKLGDRQKEVFELLQQYPNLTNSEIAVTLNRPINTITPRCKELREMGLVHESEKRICRVTQKNVIAWEIIKNTLF